MIAGLIVTPPRIAMVAEVLFDGVSTNMTFGDMPAISTTFLMSKSSMVDAVIAVSAIGVS